MRLLLVEGEHEVARITKKLLEQQKYVVDVAGSFITAKAAILDIDYDMVLLGGACRMERALP